MRPSVWEAAQPDSMRSQEGGAEAAPSVLAVPPVLQGLSSSAVEIKPAGAGIAAGKKPPLPWPANMAAKAPLPVPNQPRVWLHIDELGKPTYVQVEKQALVQTLGIPYRDLRILDPLVPMPYPTAIFIREKALVINLETIKMIICKDQVFVLSVVDMNTPDKPAKPTLEHHFVTDLCRRLKFEGPLRRDSFNVNIDTDLPYELRALEAALAEANKVLEHEVTQLEQDAWAALDNLTKKVSRAALESVRRVKTRLNRLTARVGKLREELEDLMDDDEDMADMYLGHRAEAEARGAEMEKQQQEYHSRMEQHLSGLDEGYNEEIDSPRSTVGHDELSGFHSGDDALNGRHSFSHEHYPDELSHGSDAGLHEQHHGQGIARSEGGELDSLLEPAVSAPVRALAEEGTLATLPTAAAGTAGPSMGEGRISDGEARATGEGAGQLHVTDTAMPGAAVAEAGKVPVSHKAKASFPFRSLSTPKLPLSALESVATASSTHAKSKLSMVDSFQKNIHKLEHAALDPFRRSHKPIPIKSEENELPQAPEQFDKEPVTHWRGSGQKVYWGGVDPHDIEGVEALLEAYFMQVDFSMSRLVILKERIDNTEDLINIELDSRRNELVALEVILTTLTLVFSIISAVGGIFGMNLKSGIEEDDYAFYIVTTLSIVAAIGAFLAIIIYCRQKRLMFMGVPSKI